MPGVFDAKGKPLSQRLVLHRTQAALLLQRDVTTQVRECIADQRLDYQSQ